MPCGTGLLHLVRSGWAGADILAAKWVQASHKCGAYAVYYNIGPPCGIRPELAKLDAQLQNFASQSAPGEDYTAYGAELAMQESAAALQKLLRQSGIESVVQPQAGGVHVRLVYPADREQAEILLQNFAGDLPYTLENTQ